MFTTDQDWDWKKSVRPLTLLLIVLSSMAVTACNTTRGFGQDVQEAGEEIEETADEIDD